ncbi:MAG TPA: DNA-directed RNA polymerase subunit alpha [Candidatus Sumerlaeota bacterium]|nr:MAG: DNA-directed RNA polymerase subunit alpha [candidate division BRC1 bacterium ADurb.BinA292]HOE96668.1 DNA-directed RNA polymerase subunit alpha [Candidatus Sumerlaeota bacterium]HOR27537.1 DNA-directed RNA polymerase subunit alpha [Candidatus Sumerlaeota bacterium]HPK02552.1 DNA-directed RNA polymerase subunit alpha [Candidatus Sumerlaeota bacterium]
MNFKAMIKPRHLAVETDTLTPTFGRFVAEPFERGFGVTIGNSLRRILLSSIPGAAVVSVRIEGVAHEFMVKEGLREDISDVILNLKGLHIRMSPLIPQTTVYLEAHGPKQVKASDIELNADVEILNPDHVIANLDEGAVLQMEITIATGRGYVPASEFKKDPDDIGLVAIDAVFSPIQNVQYQVESARVGQVTDFDRLVLEVHTDGTVSPEEAVSTAAQILKNHLDIFIRPGEEVEVLQPVGEEAEAALPASDVEEKLDKSIEELELSVRSYNCLEAAGIKTIRDLVQKSESEMLKYRNFGRKSLTEIKNILKEMGLGFNMRLDETGMPIMSTDENA